MTSYPCILTGGSERVGSDGAHLYDSSRSADTVTSREARTVDIVNMDNDVFRASQQYPAYVHTIRSSLIGSSSSDLNLDRDSRSSFRSSRSSSRSGAIPNCQIGQTRIACLNRVLMLVAEMLELERDRRRAITKSNH